MVMAGRCAPHFLFEASKRKCAAPGGKEKMFERAPVQWPSALTGVGVPVQAPIRPCLRARYNLLPGRYCRPVADRANGIGGHRMELRLFPLPLPWQSRRLVPSVVENNLPALGAAGGGDIGRRDQRGILSAQALRISGQVRRSGFPGLRQPIDPIVALQGAALHLFSAVWTDHKLPPFNLSRAELSVESPV